MPWWQWPASNSKLIYYHSDNSDNSDKRRFSAGLADAFTSEFTKFLFRKFGHSDKRLFLACPLTQLFEIKPIGMGAVG